MISYKDINPLEISTQVELSQALFEIRLNGHMNDQTPLFVKMVENPKFSCFRKNLVVIPGAVDSLVHDAIHVILGRGFLPEDEAFVVGFTFGSTQKWNCAANAMYRFFSQYLYPIKYRFSDEHIKILEFAVHAGMNLATIDFSSIQISEDAKLTIGELRHRFISDWAELIELYREEVRLFTPCPAHSRLKKLVHTFPCE